MVIYGELLEVLPSRADRVRDGSGLTALRLGAVVQSPNLIEILYPTRRLATTSSGIASPLS